MNSSKRFLSVAVEAAHVGGEILMRHRGKLKRHSIHRKGALDWVTDVDRASEAAILRVIRKTFPDHGIKAEESYVRDSAHSSQWLIDPLDGTVNYIHDFSMFAVSIALLHQGKLEVGVVFDPVRKELFTARRGGGAHLNGRTIHVSRHNRLKDSMIATGFPFRAFRLLPVYMKSFSQIFLKTGMIRRAGSAALDMSYTACGRFEGFWEMSLSPWDMGAGILLVEEAGGKASDFFGGDTSLDTGHVVAATRGVHRELVKILTPIFRGKLPS